MRYQLKIKKEASDEIGEAFAWYENQKAGLGSEFIKYLETYFDRITQTPLIYPQTSDQRVAILERFPYKIVYEIEEHSIVVYAVFHTSRDPEKLNR